ncbi:MAG TPA: N-acetylgalactosamine 6-sulfate sulfatase (GALNS), partial [Verrucomicrobiae bacterium]|nr:N-acetylgalactosamine 6-sulfate sulfatase (GALNS) [Verrucomicrobiae bacterium]
NAITHSVTMRYEPATNKNCLGYWVNPHDWAEWQFTVTRPGAFEIEVWQGCGKGNGGSEVQVESGGRKFAFQVVDTGDYHKLTPLRIGRVEFPAPGSYSLAVRPLEKKAGAIMDIQQVKLIPDGSP